MIVSVHTTLILYTIWQDWPLDARDLRLLALLVVHALGGLGWLAWGLRSLREREAMDRPAEIAGRALASPAPGLAPGRRRASR